MILNVNHYSSELSSITVFSFRSSSFFELRRAGGGVVDDVGDDEIRLLDHPFVPVVDREALRRGFDAIRKDGVGVVRQPVFVSLLRHIRKDDVVLDRILC